MDIYSDIFYFDGDSYLLIVDNTSRFSVVKKLTSTAAQHVTSQMKLVFSEYGWPETIISDNGPWYSAETSTKLMRDYSINNITSSPPLSTIEWLSRKLCTDSEKLIL